MGIFNISFSFLPCTMSALMAFDICYRYRLTDSIDNKFMIYPNTGRIATRVKLNREEVSQYTLEVVAMDTSLLPLSSSTTVIVNVRDMNDNAPEFSSDSYTRDLQQPTSAGINLFLFVLIKCLGVVDIMFYKQCPVMVIRIIIYQYLKKKKIE